jgi:hypothetical protein
MIRKNSDYYNTSLKIVKEFIQTITIVDDKAQFTPNEPDSFFDAGQIIKQFAEDGKICSVFKFSEKEDIDKIIKIAQRSDITILDWKIELPENFDKKDSEEDESEEDEVQSRGFYTLKILKEIISSKCNSLKVFIIYTDEEGLNRIADEIKRELNQIGIQTQDETPYSFYCLNNKISIFGKEIVKAKATHVKEIASRSYNYEELPGAVYDEFVRFTHGVVAGIFLKTIAAIRANTYLLLNTFQRDIDAAFITHKGLLPIPDDAHDHIVELIGSEMKSVMNGGLTNETTNSLIENFIDLLDENHFLEYKDDQGVQKKLSGNEFKLFLCDPKQKTNFSKNTIKSLPESLPKSIAKADNPLLSHQEIEDKANKSNIEFAKLTTLKNRYLEFSKPILTLGVILKRKNTSGEDEYWICVQPKCDSIRISEDENNDKGRAFLFLSLSKTDKGEIIYDKDIRFKIEYSIKKAKQFMFKPTENEMVYVRGEHLDRWFFQDSNEQRFEYLCELKNDFAQSIANNFGSQVSRVAVNHSEWLRLQTNR